MKYVQVRKKQISASLDVPSGQTRTQSFFKAPLLWEEAAGSWREVTKINAQNLLAN